MLAPWIFVIFVLGFCLPAGAWALWISEFPNAGVWRARRELLMDLSERMGLEVERANCVAQGLLEGHAFRVGVKTVRGSKSTSIILWGELTVEGCPSSLTLSEESILDGLSRAFGAKEQTIGDAQFDGVFFIKSDNIDETRAFLTPLIRNALAQGLPRLRARLEKGTVVSETTLMTPLRMGSAIRELLLGYQHLALALNGQGPLAEEKTRVDPIQRKLRRFASRSLLVWMPVFLLSLFTLTSSEPTAAERCLQVGAPLGLLLTASVYRGHEVARVFLQGFYAFATLASGLVLLAGVLESAEVHDSSYLHLHDTDVIGFTLFWAPLTLFFWGARHYLKVLDRSAKARRGV